MITIADCRQGSEYDYKGLSTDTKPTDCADVVKSDNTMVISARTGRGDVDGTYHIEVYKLKYADGSASPFA